MVKLAELFEGDKFNRLITKLTRLTAEDKLPWAIETAPSGLRAGTDHIIPIYYQTSYRDHRFGLFERRFKAFSEEIEQLYWSSVIVFVLVDAHDRVTWESDDNQLALTNLYKLVAEKTADLDSFFDDVLSD